MDEINTNEVASLLATLANEYLDSDMYFEEDRYHVLHFTLGNQDAMKLMMHNCKFKVVGDKSDYPEVFGKDMSTKLVTSFDGENGIIAISEKYNSIIVYTKFDGCYGSWCDIDGIIDDDNVKKFSKKMAEIISNQTSAGVFDGVKFKCKKNEYIEISNIIYIDRKSEKPSNKPVSIVKKKLPKENLVFDTSSPIFNVMTDIKNFFTDETKKTYHKLHIGYKRGVIIYGEPGNGKTAMIREIIRQLHDVTTVIINPNTPRVPFILTELMTSLKGKPTLIVIEDIDAVINNSNRSELLNTLDGVTMQSGVYFIGTTNYPEKIDPAFMNRSGRFNRSFKIGNPNESMRKAFFRNAKIGDVLSAYKKYKPDSENTRLSIVELFVKYSDGLSMTNLQELVVDACNRLAQTPSMSIEEALIASHDVLVTSVSEHVQSYQNYAAKNSNISQNPVQYCGQYDDEYDSDDEEE